MFLAQREGFEPPETLVSTVFKTAAIDHSTISANVTMLIILKQERKVNENHFENKRFCLKTAKKVAQREKTAT